MPGKKLTHRFVKGLQPPKKPTEYYDENESGLILRLSKAGSRTFATGIAFRVKRGGLLLVSFLRLAFRTQEQKLES